MIDRSTGIVAPLGRWSSRIALFSATLLIITLVLHRLASFPTPVAINIFLVGAAGALLAVLIGLIALVQIWRRGYKGAASAAVGILLPVLLLAWPLTFAPAFLKQPALNDVTTDWAAPPRFVELAKQRTAAGNPAAYPGERFAAEQQKAYPDLRTFVLDRPVEETFELVEEVVRKLKWRVAATTPPAGKPAKAGTLEATDQTLLAGFTDDISIRIEGSATRSRVDVRSASRHGAHDLGNNAARVRRFLNELQARAESTTPAGIAGRRGSRASAMVKKLKARDPKKAEARTAKDRAQSSAQRAKGQKETR
jgi:uncharacterized protein (DUF1499 family)